MLAEDNRVDQRVVLGQLKKLGCEAYVACNGREVPQALQQDSYDLVLMDCQMPELDGYETTRTVRQLEQESAIAQPLHIIAMTANAIQGDREFCLEARMNDYHQAAGTGRAAGRLDALGEPGLRGALARRLLRCRAEPALFLRGGFHGTMTRCTRRPI